MKILRSMDSIYLGCDPEVFLVKEVGKVRKRMSIVGSEVVIPESGLGRITRDGVQLEFHPNAETCRASMSNDLSGMFGQLKEAISKHPGLKVSFDQVVKLSKLDLMKLSPESRQLACIPSLNVYGRKFIRKDGEKYPYRSAAGHIHVGCPAIPEKRIDVEKLVKLYDVVVGNTSVMIDRDPNASLRRKLYGRAGEYRLPCYGVEYRTLSNFWLQGYPVFSLMMALMRQTTKIAQSGYARKSSYSTEPIWNNADEVILKDVDFDAIERAINTNDLALARENYTKWVRPFFAETISSEGLNGYNLDGFDYFLKVIEEKGLKEWFPMEPLEHWATKGDGHGRGWESFMSGTIIPSMARKDTQAVTFPPPKLEPSAGGVPAAVTLAGSYIGDDGGGK